MVLFLLMFWRNSKRCLCLQELEKFFQRYRKFNSHLNSFFLLPLPPLDLIYIFQEDSWIMEEILILCDAFEIRIIDFVHNMTLIKKFERFIQSIYTFLDERFYVDFEFIEALTSFNQWKTLFISLNASMTTFWRNIV